MTAICMAIVSRFPSVYQSTAVLLVGGEEQTNRSSSDVLRNDVASILNSGYGENAQSDVDILKSESLFRTALFSVADKLGKPELKAQLDDLYARYNLVTQEQSLAAQIVTQAYDPEVAAMLANEIAATYNEKRLESMRSNLASAREYLEAQVQIAQKDLSGAERRYSAYKESIGTTDIAIRTQAETQYINDLQHQVDQAKAELAGAQQQVAELKVAVAARPRNIEASQVNEVSPNVRIYEQQLAEEQRARLDMLQIYDETAPQVRHLDEAIASIKKQLASLQNKRFETVQRATSLDPIRQQLESQLVTALGNQEGYAQQVALLSDQLSRETAKSAVLPSYEYRLTQLKRDLDLADLTYRNLKSQAEDVKNREESGPRAAQVLFQAIPNNQRVAPDPPKWIIFGIVAGVCFGLLYSFGVEALKLPVHSATQLSSTLGLPVAASVPRLNLSRAGAELKRLPGSSFTPSESFRFLTFSVLAQRNQVSRTVLFTGIGEGTSSAACAGEFAVAMAAAGIDTLLVDADLRRLKLTNAFGMVERPGLSDMLDHTLLPSGQEEPVGHTTEHANLRFLPSGRRQPNGLVGYPLSEVSGQLQSLRQEASMVVVSAPPCDIVSDAASLASQVDEIYLVISATSSNTRNVAAACDILRRAGAPRVSMILVNASPQDEPFAEEAEPAVAV